MPSPATSRPSGGSFYRNLPVWLQWVIPFGTAAILLIALVVWVHHKTDDTSSEAGVTNSEAIVEQNREARILIGQQQAPHVAALRPSETPVVGVHAAVVAFMHAQVASGEIAGDVTTSGCVARPTASTAGRAAFRCTVVSGSVNYPFYAIVETASRQITFCRFVPAPVSGMNIPVSSRCR